MADVIDDTQYYTLWHQKWAAIANDPNQQPWSLKESMLFLSMMVYKKYRQWPLEVKNVIHNEQ